ncbi:MAG: hypothetical protein ACOCZK_00110 [Planctomycetota bacterium]
MALRAWFPLLLATLLGLGCDPAREPEGPAVARGRAMAAADAYLDHRELDWGAIVRVWQPEADPLLEGLWWQIDYRVGPAGEHRCLLVDAQSAWVRRPPADYRARIDLRATSPAVPRTGRVRERPVREDDDTWIVVCEPPHAPGPDQAGRVAELNAAVRGRWRELFTLRELPGDRVQVVYGWEGDSGIVRDDELLHALRQLPGCSGARWIDLAAD